VNSNCVCVGKSTKYKYTSMLVLFASYFFIPQPCDVGPSSPEGQWSGESFRARCTTGSAFAHRCRPGSRPFEIDARFCAVVGIRSFAPPPQVSQSVWYPHLFSPSNWILGLGPAKTWTFGILLCAAVCIHFRPCELFAIFFCSTNDFALRRQLTLRSGERPMN
jgi:hypothetical protein